MIISTPPTPYYAVIFTSILDEHDPEYFRMNDMLRQQAEKLDGFLGEDSARNDYGISISYWKDLDSIQQWRQNADHQWAKQKGRKDFYKEYKIRIARVEREYDFKKTTQ
ncbi:antibiotic biosynthesis monooxygenase [Flavobacteriaceae bacterium]|nr:antibiotic biosynthesis monooxygenase [Flavobacteriaceae bacterium]|tara:strand:+ start:1080 stop:1406 length:327 start_codon:yes stop_codon:yes gene_type:complete